jgi:hypothetical protein
MVGVVVKDVPPLNTIRAITWWRKPGDTEPGLSRHEGNEAFLNKLAA